MKNKAILLVLTLSLILAACSGSKATTPPVRPAPTALITVPAQSDIAGPDSGCTVISRKPTPGPTAESIFPPAGKDDWVKGPENARVTIIEYSDFQCPYCATLAPMIEKVLEDFPTEVRFVYRHFPLIGTPESPFHPNAALATQAAEAAGKQGKFWEMHDILFENQSQWSGLSSEQFQGWLVTRAAELGLDTKKFERDMLSDALVKFAQEAWNFGQRVGMPGTPFLLINGNVWPSNVSMDYTNITAVIKLTLLEDRQFTQCPPMTIDPNKQYLATIHTKFGNIVIELYADKAPIAVNSFIFLANHDWYDGVTFHRVIPGFVAQAGDPTGTGFGGPGYAFKNEISPDLKFDRAGVVGMANAGADSNGSQFFITYAAAPNLDGNYTIFGQVIAGMDVVNALTPRDPAKGLDLPPGDVILDITIEEK